MLLLVLAALLVLTFVLFRSGYSVPLLLHLVRTLASLLASKLLSTTAGHATELFVSLDQVVKRLIVHCVVHINQFELIFVLAPISRAGKTS